MDLVLNFGMAWLSVILAALLSVIYILRKRAKENTRHRETLEKVNRFLRRHHKIVGLVLIATGLVHGLFSSQSVWSLNLGTLAWILSILLGLNWLFKKELTGPGRKGWMYYHRALTVAFTVILLMHVANVGVQAPTILIDSLRSSTDTARLASGQAAGAAGQAAAGATQATVEQKLNIGSADMAAVQAKFSGVTLKDGTYQGVADGYGTGLTVSVVVKGGAVTSVQVIKHNEVNSRFYSRPIQLIPQEIVTAQSLDVDLVAGATFTSTGIVNAVRNALSGAVTSGTLPPALSLPARGRKR